MVKENNSVGKEHLASAKSTNLSVSTKHSVEISKFLRYKKTNLAKKILEDIISLKSPIPFKTHNTDMGHKAGMAAGRYPTKAAKEFLTLIKSAEANAQAKGLNSSSLIISKLVPNKASTPFTGGRRRRGTKRTHLEIEVVERKSSKTSSKNKQKADKSGKTEAVKPKKEDVISKNEEKATKDELVSPVSENIKKELPETATVDKKETTDNSAKNEGVNSQ